jgi:hypothetical protein
MPQIVIRDEFLDFVIDGDAIAGPVTTEYADSTGRPRVRWFECTLYRKADGSYVIHQVNRSVVWHLASGSGHVKLPETIPYAERDEDDVYCGDLPARAGRRQCPRSRPAAAPQTVLREADQHRAISCPTSGAVIREVATVRRGDGSQSVAISDLMRELLRKAAENDPAFRGVVATVNL